MYQLIGVIFFIEVVGSLIRYGKPDISGLVLFHAPLHSALGRLGFSGQSNKHEGGSSSNLSRVILPLNMTSTH